MRDKGIERTARKPIMFSHRAQEVSAWHYSNPSSHFQVEQVGLLYARANCHSSWRPIQLCGIMCAIFVPIGGHKTLAGINKCTCFAPPQEKEQLSQCCGEFLLLSGRTGASGQPLTALLFFFPNFQPLC